MGPKRALQGMGPKWFLFGMWPKRVQRFKSAESVAAGTLSGPVARNLEVIPQTEISSLGLSERNEAVALEEMVQDTLTQGDALLRPTAVLKVRSADRRARSRRFCSLLLWAISHDQWTRWLGELPT